MPAVTVIERIPARKSTLGEGLEIARALPTRGRRMIGAWCFLDHIGPIQFPEGQGMHVGAHPHTRLQTFTWMIEGEILHRDSLGSEQMIRPMQVNLMTAGHGISHTEDSVSAGAVLHAAQLWIALPDAVAEQAPSFAHYASVPRWQEQGCDWALMAGSYGAHQAPTELFSPLLGLEIVAAGETTVTLALEPSFEYGCCALSGGFQVLGQVFAMDELAYMSPGVSTVTLRLQPGTRLLVIGGEPFTDPVTMWWNFIGPDMASIRRYQAQWEQQDARFGSVTGGEHRRLVAPRLP